MSLSTGFLSFFSSRMLARVTISEEAVADPPETAGKGRETEPKAEGRERGSPRGLLLLLLLLWLLGLTSPVLSTPLATLLKSAILGSSSSKRSVDTNKNLQKTSDGRKTCKYLSRIVTHNFNRKTYSESYIGSVAARIICSVCILLCTGRNS